MNIDNLGVAVPSNLINEKLPPPTFQIALSYLKHRDLQSAAVVCRFWNASVFDMVKIREFTALRSFVMFISDNLDENLYSEQKKKLSQFQLSNLEFRCASIKAVNEKMSVIKAVIQSILKTIEDKDLSKIFDSFIGKKKPPLFFEFVFTSQKYRRWNDDFGAFLNFPWFLSIEGIKTLIEIGAIPTTENLNRALIIGHPEVVRTLLDAGAVPSTATLNLALIHRHPEVVRTLLDAGAIPTAETLNLAMIHSHPLEVIRALFDAGAAIPTGNDLNLALRHSSEIFRLFEAVKEERKMRKLAIE